MLKTVKRSLIPILKRLPLRVVLSIPFVVQTAAVIVLVGYLSHVEGQQAINTLAQQLMSEVHERVQQHLQAYTQEPQQIVQLIADDIESGRINLTPDNLQSLDAYFLKRTQNFSSVSFIYVGNEQGKFIGAGPVRKANQTSYIVEVTDGTTNRNYVSYAVDAFGRRTRQINAVPNYDPRRRPWYQAAIATGKATWSKIYPFIGEANQGLTITAVKPYQTPAGKLGGVAAVDLYLNDINVFLENLQIAQSGQVFILEPSGALVASSNRQPSYIKMYGQPHRLTAFNSQDELIRTSAEQIKQQLGGLDQIHSPRHLEFKFQEQRYFGQVARWQDGLGLDWVIVAVVPESDFMGQIYANMQTTFLLAGIAIFTAIVFSLSTARWVITPILELNRAAKDIAKGKWENPISLDRGDEVGQLARSFNQMASQLQLSFDALQQGQQQIAEFLEAVPIAITVVKPGGGVSYMNQAAQQLLGYPFQPGLTMQSVAVYHQVRIAETDRPYPSDRLPSVRALRGESFTIDDLEIQVEGQTIALEVRATPIFTPEGEVSYAILAFQDIRNRRQTEKLLADYNRILEAQISERTTELTRANWELEQAKQAAESANYAKSTFLANMSHELRTPLNAILGFAQVMRLDPKVTAEQQHNLQVINRSGEHLLSLINNVLDLSKIEAGRVDLVETCFNLYDLLETIDDMLRQRAEAKGLWFQMSLDANLPRQIIADPSKLRQVLINLIGNAIKFTDRGSVTLKVRSSIVEPLPTEATARLSNLDQVDEPNKSEESSETTANCLLCFEVVDTGIGIDPNQLDRIFDPFEQSSKGKITPEGTGLGLTISRRFVELMGGTLTVRSNPNQGSTFTVELPVCSAEWVNLASLPQRPVIGLAPNQPQYSILIVDDQPENRELLIRLLNPLQVTIQEAVNGQEALVQWHQLRPNLVLMDIHMPQMDGLAATRQIRYLEQENRLSTAFSTFLSPQYAKTKIIALSASVLESDQQQAIAAGCDGFLGKPFQTEVLYEMLAQHLGLHYHYAEPEPEDVRLNRPSTLGSNRSTLSPEDPSLSLNFMSSEWRNQLYQAAIRCQDEQVIELLDQIPPKHSALSHQLRDFAQRFQFEMILQLLRGYSSDNQISY